MLRDFNFLIVFIGVIVGLSVGQLMTFSGHLVSSLPKLRISCTHGIYLVLLFLSQTYEV